MFNLNLMNQDSIRQGYVLKQSKLGRALCKGPLIT